MSRSEPRGIIVAIKYVLLAHIGHTLGLSVGEIGYGTVEKSEYVVIHILLRIEFRLLERAALQSLRARDVTVHIGEYTPVDSSKHLSHTQEVFLTLIESALATLGHDIFEIEKIGIGAVPHVIECR